jgi:hypothetical protein
LEIYVSKIDHNTIDLNTFSTLECRRHSINSTPSSSENTKSDISSLSGHHHTLCHVPSQQTMMRFRSPREAAGPCIGGGNGCICELLRSPAPRRGLERVEQGFLAVSGAWQWRTNIAIAIRKAVQAGIMIWQGVGLSMQWSVTALANLAPSAETLALLIG